MHSLLSRQLRKCRTPGGEIDIDALVASVDKTYKTFERERYLTNRARVLMEGDLRAAHEQSRAQAERFLKTVLDTVGEGVVLCDGAGAIVDNNMAVARLFGYQAEDLRGRSIDTLVVVGPEADFGRRRDGSRFPIDLVIGDLARLGTCQRVYFIRDISDRMEFQRELALREERFRDYAESSSDWFWETDDHHVFTCFLGQLELVSDVLQRSVIGRTRIDLMQGCCSEAQIAAHADDLAAHRPFRHFTYRARMPDGKTRVLSVSGKPRFDSAGTFLGYRGTATDMTERQRMLDQLEMSASVFANALEGIMITDRDGNILSVNTAFSDITGYPAEDVIGRNPRFLKSQRHGQHFYQDMWRDLQTKGWWRGEIWNRRASGDVYLQASTISTIPDEDGTVKYLVAVFSDVTKVREKDERIRYLAHHDDLTGLANRRLLQDRLNHAFELSRRDGGLLAVMFLDLDHFKYVNDSLGHEVGDRLLREVAQRVVGCVRRTDTVARMGGDEFVIILDTIDSANDVAHVATKLTTALAEPYIVSGQTLHVTVSIGISLFPDDAGDVTTLMKNADTAMYAAKLQGRNTFRFFDAAMNQRAVQRLSLEADLRRALRGKQFEMFYQPKIRLADGLVDGVEALIRWRHPVRGLLAPAEFIPVAEETGLIIDLGNMAFDLACRQRADWLRRYRHVPTIAVNVSPIQLRDGGELVRRMARSLDEHAIDGRGIEVEVTETAVMTDPDEAIRSLAAIKATGIAIAIDDFGTGYSSLSSLKKLPVDTLKIDRSFVSDIETSEDDAGIVQMILGLSRLLGLATVAEGVESLGQERMLAEWGCQSTQGYYYARPMPANDLERWLARRVAQDVAAG